MSTPPTMLTIRRLLAARSQALSTKNAAAVINCQTSNVVVYSMAPPLVASDPKALQAWFDTWDGPIGYETQQLHIEASEKVAFVHALVRMSGRRTDGSSTGLWFRLTLGLLHQGSDWKVAHEHQSTPFYMDGSLRAAVDLTPA